jgi:secreted trypsin-like serine protease
VLWMLDYHWSTALDLLLIINLKFMSFQLSFFLDALGRAYNDLTANDYEIVGGDKITIEQAPYQVYLLVKSRKREHSCGGSLISSQAVLTAAHCLSG